ncbi:endopeptidase [bacterium]|nr:endopeptidase [bacterium]
MLDPLDLSGQKKHRENLKKSSTIKKKIEAEDLKWVMGNKRGRRFAWRLLDRAGIYRTSFTGNSTTFFNEGMRNIGLMLVADIHEACPEAYALMIKENRNDTDIDDASRK